MAPAKQTVFSMPQTKAMAVARKSEGRKKPEIRNWKNTALEGGREKAQKAQKGMAEKCGAEK
jgi:hypothetical protein